ncbi:hypothetical protein LUZ60_017432 [Juncus effusus]|nr:hypothetical protein LUZ60_017432 [Juncus effusus]
MSLPQLAGGSVREKEMSHLINPEIEVDFSVLMICLKRLLFNKASPIESKEERSAMIKKLHPLKKMNNPLMWQQVIHILQNYQKLDTKLVALQVLEKVIKYTWSFIPVQHRDEIRNYIPNLIVQLSAHEESFIRQRQYIDKLNLIMVQVLKHDEPERWKTFIADMIPVAQASETICENCMCILKLLIEEVYKYSKGEMPQRKIDELKEFLWWGIWDIHHLFLCINTARDSLGVLTYSLATESLLCLIQLAKPMYVFPSDTDFVIKMYRSFMVQMKKMFPWEETIGGAHYYEEGSEELAFIRNLAVFFTSFYKAHMRVLETAIPEDLWLGHHYLIDISYIDDSTIFDVCFGYWNLFVKELPHEAERLRHQDRSEECFILLRKLKWLIICRFAKKSRVGNIVRNTLGDLDILVELEIMRDIMMHLARHNAEHTKQQETEFMSSVQEELQKLKKGEDTEPITAINIVGREGIEKLFSLIRHGRLPLKDKACDTLVKIARNCMCGIVTKQGGENEPYVCRLLEDLPTLIAGLKPRQVHALYESFGHMIAAERDDTKRAAYLRTLMRFPNQMLVQICQAYNIDIVEDLKELLLTYASVARVLGPFIFRQLSSVFLEMPCLYRKLMAEEGPDASRASIPKPLGSVNTVKREVLKLIESYITAVDHWPELFVEDVTAMVIADYDTNVRAAWEFEVLSLWTTMFVLSGSLSTVVLPPIHEADPRCALDMIKKETENNPEYFVKLFSLLEHFDTRSIEELTHHQLKLVMETVNWACEHAESEVAEKGLVIVLAWSYFSVQHDTKKVIFSLFINTFHILRVKRHVSVLNRFFKLVKPLCDVCDASTSCPCSVMHIKHHLIDIWSTLFPRRTQAEVKNFVDGLYDKRETYGVFEEHIKEFLAQSESSAQLSNERNGEDSKGNNLNTQSSNVGSMFGCPIGEGARTASLLPDFKLETLMPKSIDIYGGKMRFGTFGWIPITIKTYSGKYGNKRVMEQLQSFKHRDLAVAIGGGMFSKDIDFIAFLKYDMTLSMYLDEYPGLVRGSFTTDVRGFLFDILRALSFLHENDMSCWDLSSCPILLKELGEPSRRQYRAVLFDFLKIDDPKDYHDKKRRDLINLAILLKQLLRTYIIKQNKKYLNEVSHFIDRLENEVSSVCLLNEPALWTREKRKMVVEVLNENFENGSLRLSLRDINCSENWIAELDQQFVQLAQSAVQNRGGIPYANGSLSELVRLFRDLLHHEDDFRAYLDTLHIKEEYADSLILTAFPLFFVNTKQKAPQLFGQFDF